MPSIGTGRSGFQGRNSREPPAKDNQHGKKLSTHTWRHRHKGVTGDAEWLNQPHDQADRSVRPF